MTRLKIGSEQHKEIFCREFLDTHLVYDVTTLDWPRLDAASTARLRALPFWDEAVSTERAAAAKMHAQAVLETDPLLHEAIALQGREEARHSHLLGAMLAAYGISTDSTPPQAGLAGVSAGGPAQIEWAFLRTEYGECFDSFNSFLPPR